VITTTARKITSQSKGPADWKNSSTILRICGPLPTPWLSPPRPVDRNRASEDKRQSNFGFYVRYKVGNEPRGVGVPIDQGDRTGRRFSYSESCSQRRSKLSPSR
jgi:hypothetical protein